MWPTVTPDVNVLAAASRSDHPMVIARFLRLVTIARIFVNPTPIAAALRFIEAVLAAPGVVRPRLGGVWTLLHRLWAANERAANDIPDAWLAAAVTHQGEHLVTFDGNFRRLLTRSEFLRLAI